MYPVTAQVFAQLRSAFCDLIGENKKKEKENNDRRMKELGHYGVVNDRVPFMIRNDREDCNI